VTSKEEMIGQKKLKDLDFERMVDARKKANIEGNMQKFRSNSN
jgi:hypothetical protein